MKDFETERWEAITAGETALRSLNEAKSCLSTARGLGIWDLFGGGSLVSLVKHGKISRAQTCMDNAKIDLEHFNNELRDIHADLNIDISGLLMVFDFWDSFIADVMVQSRIRKAAEEVDRAICEVQKVLSKLRYITC